MKQRNRILSLMLAVLLVVGMVPINTLTAVAATDTSRHIMLGTDVISGYDTTNGYDYLYYGSYEGEPVKWRVLDNKTNTGEVGLFLLSEDLISEGGEYGGIYFDTGETNTYQNSDAQIWCNGFYSTAFSQIEQREIIDTTKSDASYTSSSNSIHFNAVNNILNADKVFFLSAEEAENENYGFADNSSRVAEYNRNAGYWWLRSPGNDSTTVGYVEENGNISTANTDKVGAARPAFNLSTNKVLFTSAADGVTTNTNASEYLTSVGTYSGKEYKLTLLDENRAGFSVTEENMQVVRHQTVRVHFTGAGTGTNDYVSLFIVDENENVLHYGSIAKSSDAGNAEFEVPSDIPNGNYTIKVFSEQKNGANKTDYASPFDEIALTVGDGHEHCVCGGNTNIGDHTTHDDIEFTPWTSTDSMPTTTGNYVLTNDVIISSSWQPADGTVLCLNGHDIKTSMDNRDSIDVGGGWTFTLCDCVGSGEITSAENAGGIENKGTFNFYGGTIKGNDGNGINNSDENISVLKMYGGIIKENGGYGIYNWNSLTIYGGEISSNGNTGVYNGHGAYFAMHGGKITGNTGVLAGGVHIGCKNTTETFIMTGGEISGNATSASSQYSAGGLRLQIDESTDIVRISGNVKISDNTLNGAENNIKLTGTMTEVIEFGTLTSGADIGISMMSPGKFSTAFASSDAATAAKAYISSDDNDYTVAVDGENLKLVKAESHTHNYTYFVNGFTITESCTCGHTATAEIVKDYDGTAIYNGSAYGAKVVYADNWAGDKVTELKYYKKQINDGNLVTECIDAGDYFAVLTVEGATAEWSFTISQKEPVISIKPAVSNIVVNSKLSDISLNGGTALGIGDAKLEGEFSWKEPTAVMGTVGLQNVKVVFIPEDKNYRDKTFELEVNVVNCDTDSGEHDVTEQMNNADEHWTVCAKCGVEEPESRTAHTYENGKCKVCGISDPNYKPTSPQTGDNSNMALMYALLFISGLGIAGTHTYRKKRRI